VSIASIKASWCFWGGGLLMSSTRPSKGWSSNWFCSSYTCYNPLIVVKASTTILWSSTYGSNGCKPTNLNVLGSFKLPYSSFW
jgi:hypothetical protein